MEKFKESLMQKLGIVGVIAYYIVVIMISFMPFYATIGTFIGSKIVSILCASLYAMFILPIPIIGNIILVILEIWGLILQINYGFDTYSLLYAIQFVIAMTIVALPFLLSTKEK